MPPFGDVPVSSLGPVTAGDRGGCQDIGGVTRCPQPVPGVVWLSLGVGWHGNDMVVLLSVP